MVKPKMKSKAGRIRNPKKTTRWPKGDSCLSNPEIHKFRDEASSLYFHQVVKNPLLTVKNLSGRQLDSKIDDDVLSADIQSLTVSDGLTGCGDSLASYKSFASNWSQCSNAAFQKFLGRCHLDSALHKEMLSILAATTEVINSCGGSHRETEYFASFIAVMESCEPTQYQATMTLLSIVSGRVPENVLQRTFPIVFPKLATILAYGMEEMDNSLMRVTLDVLKKVLGVQDTSVFESQLAVKSLIYSILRCASHDNPKVRRKARQTIGFILTRQKEKTENDSSVVKIVLGWTLDQLATYPSSGSKSAGDVIGLLQFIWSNLDSVPPGGTKKLYETILRVMSSGEVPLIKIGFSYFTVVFQTTLSAEVELFIPKLVSVLWDFRTDWRNNDAFLLWLHCFLNGLIRLADNSPTLAGPYISRVFEEISNSWNSTWGQVPTKVTVEYLYHLIRPELSHDDIENCFAVISKNLITLPPNENCLTLLAGFVDSLKAEQFTISGREILLQLLQLRNSNLSPRIYTLLGQFVKSFKIDNLWISVEPEIRYTVILSLVRDNLCGDSLSYWKENIFPILKLPVLKKYWPTVWESLIGFCRDPSDPENFPAELVGNVIGNKPQYRLTTLGALRQLTLWPQCKSVLQKYATNYLPIFFNIYVNERQAQLAVKKKGKVSSESIADISEILESHPGHADAVATTIQDYLPQLEPEFIMVLLKRALTKFSEASPGEKGPIMDLLSLLSVYSLGDIEIEEQLFGIASDAVQSKEHMKRGYRVVRALLENKTLSTVTRNAIVKLLWDNNGKGKSNVEPVRLECLNLLILKDDDWMAKFLPEAILSLLSINTSARRVAVKFVKSLCHNLTESKLSLDKIRNIITLGLDSGNPFIISCTIHFLSEVYTHSPPKNPDESLINSCINHILTTSSIPDPSVSREGLSFLSRNLSLYRNEMGRWAGSMGKILSLQTHLNLPRKEVNKILARMIKIFGVPGLKAVLPNAQDPQMMTRIKNLQRKLRKLKEKKVLEKNETLTHHEISSESEEDEEIGHGFASKNLSTKDKVLMKEGVVDFLDPQNVMASLISKPKYNNTGNIGSENDFKVSSDGKLIIEELEEKRGKKRPSSTRIQPTINDDNEFGDLQDETEKERIRKKRKGNSGLSISSSRHSRQSRKSNRSQKTTKSTASSTKTGSFKIRPKLRAKRRLTIPSKTSSTSSIRSAGKSKWSGRKTGRSNYKR